LARMWGALFERGFGPVVTQTTKRMIERMDEYICIYISMYVFFKSFVSKHMTVRHLLFLVTNGNAATVSRHMFLNTRFAPQLFSG